MPTESKQLTVRELIVLLSSLPEEKKDWLVGATAEANCVRVALTGKFFEEFWLDGACFVLEGD